MRATMTSVVLLGSNRPLIARSVTIPAERRDRGWGRLFMRRRQPTLFHRCLAVHMATAGTLSALR
jgi:hypothetical protein